MTEILNNINTEYKMTIYTMPDSYIVRLVVNWAIWE